MAALLNSNQSAASQRMNCSLRTHTQSAVKVLALDAALALLATASPTTQAHYVKGGRLVTVVPGIRDEASDSWVNTAAAIAPTTQKWVIREAGTGPYSNLTEVPANHIITLPTDASPQAVKGAIRAIAGDQNVTVIVDMKLGWNVSESGWAPHTKWASEVSQDLAEAHAKHFPSSESVFIGHSAGTEPAAMMPSTMPDTRAGNGGKKRRLYDDMIVLSGRRSPDDPGYPKWAVLAFVDGDLYANPKGHIGAESVLKSYGPATAEKLAQEGYSVVRVVQPTGSAWTEATMDVLQGPLGTLIRTGKSRLAAHTKITDVTANDQMVYYPGGDAPSIPLPETALANGLNMAAEVQDGRITNPQDAIDAMKSSQPTQGIGGISLNATAYVPFDASDIDSAGYSAEHSALFLKLKNGTTWMLPSLDPQVWRQCYDTVFKDGEKPELSISDNRATAPNGKRVLDLQKAGNFSVYYFGHSRGTLLGLTMFQADHMLGSLAFTTSGSVRDVAAHVPGFRSLVELFPEKYASNPAQGSYLGSDGRIFLTPNTVVLKRAPNRHSLLFTDLSVSIHFGQTGPAEAAYGAFFSANFSDIMKTKSGAAFANLVPYARGAAIFRWLRDSGIKFDPGPLDDVQVDQVFTPASSPVEWGPNLADVAVKAPTIFYSRFGPARIIRGDGSEADVTYRNGKVTKVKRWDGQVLLVDRDSLGMPLGIKWGNNAAAFLVLPKYGLVLARNVHLGQGEYGANVSLTKQSSFYPIVNPETIVAHFVMRFANGDHQL